MFLLLLIIIVIIIIVIMIITMVMMIIIITIIIVIIITIPNFSPPLPILIHSHLIWHFFKHFHECLPRENSSNFKLNYLNYKSLNQKLTNFTKSFITTVTGKLISYSCNKFDSSSLLCNECQSPTYQVISEVLCENTNKFIRQNKIPQHIYYQQQIIIVFSKESLLKLFLQRLFERSI